MVRLSVALTPCQWYFTLKDSEGNDDDIKIEQTLGQVMNFSELLKLLMLFSSLSALDS